MQLNWSVLVNFGPEIIIRAIDSMGPFLLKFNREKGFVITNYRSQVMS